jgi:hypothetical protein
MHGTGESSSTLHFNCGRCQRNVFKVIRQHLRIFGNAEYLNSFRAFHLHSGRFESNVYGVNWQDVPVIVVFEVL